MAPPESSTANKEPAGADAAVHAPAPPPPSRKITKCQEVSAFYQKKFPAVQALRAEDLPGLLGSENSNSDSNNCIFVDVRTAAERAVSMIDGALTLDEFEADQAEDCTHQQLLQEQPVVVYCTIGYRSGLEATRLHRCYPGLRIYNLDGIVAYSHQCCRNNDDDTSCWPQLIVPATGEPATQIHTFSRAWDYVVVDDHDKDGLQSVYFSAWQTPLRLLQVGGRVVVRTAQTVVYHCHCGGRRKKHPCRVH